ncbi:ribonuclease P protein component [Motilibacter deserti]|uniref:Ribonuclease P protein component n=1 Tax=Motilibacter deserti TaxID=2714956 RepID=A0ABX0H315_9ACTN|nr:ribonuclease P protein component [Motilibacter deserti]
MLPAAARLRSRTDFAVALRRGPGSGRGASRCVVVHVRLAEPEAGTPVAEVAAVAADGAGGTGGSAPVSTASSQPASFPLVGFAVSRAVGNAVVRNGVRRRLRALVRDRLDLLPAGSRVVVRALPASAAVRFSVLADELDRALGQALRAARRPAQSPA